MSATDLNTLKRKLILRLKSMTDVTPNAIRTLITTALECVETVEAPMRLKRLAQRAVMSAMSNRNRNRKRCFISWRT